METALAGDRGMLVTMRDATPGELRAFAEKMRAEGNVCVIGYESVLVLSSPSPRVRGEGPRSGGEGTRHRIAVSFRDDYAPDLTIPHDELFAGIPRLTVRFLGFRPGFAYLDGWPEKWRMPRRPTSRNRVPRGSFAVAGAFAGFYAIDSPGGWNLLGRTAAPLWDPRRDPPNLLAPGDEIEIVPTMDAVELPPLDEAPPEPAGEPLADILSPGQFTAVVGPADEMRLEHGLPTGGPFDPELAAAANRAAGNVADAPLLECVLVGPRLRFRAATRIAWNDQGRDVEAGEEIDIGRFRDGFRGYLAVRGGVAAMTRSALWTAQRPATRQLSNPATARADRLTIHVLRGPHQSHFRDSEWQVTPQLDRVGIRLQPLQRIDAEIPADLPSCGMQFGTVQWHPDGSLVVMGPDHPVTGGYLQPVTVLSTERWKLAQLAPGERVWLRTV